MDNGNFLSLPICTAACLAHSNLHRRIMAHCSRFRLSNPLSWLPFISRSRKLDLGLFSCLWAKFARIMCQIVFHVGVSMFSSRRSQLPRYTVVHSGLLALDAGLLTRAFDFLRMTPLALIGGMFDETRSAINKAKSMWRDRTRQTFSFNTEVSRRHWPCFSFVSYVSWALQFYIHQRGYV